MGLLGEAEGVMVVRMALELGFPGSGPGFDPGWLWGPRLHCLTWLCPQLVTGDTS